MSISKNEQIIIGQEVICPDGLGRVVAYSINDQCVGQFVKVDTYIKNRSCEWAPHNVTLVPINSAAKVKLDFEEWFRQSDEQLEYGSMSREGWDVARLYLGQEFEDWENDFDEQDREYVSVYRTAWHASRENM